MGEGRGGVLARYADDLVVMCWTNAKPTRPWRG